jgi:glycerol-3-phosphate O-acyltransferase / dihydroxyacetone phosphate acyltransferase
VEWVRALTANVGQALRQVTLNLEEWDDLALVETADQLFALRNGFRQKDSERLRLLAKGAAVVRREQPERFDELKDDLMSFRLRLEMVAASPQDLRLEYRRSQVGAFVLKNLAALLLGVPLCALGLFLFAAPFLFVRVLSRVVPLPADRVATLKFVASLVMVPLWWTALSVAGWALWGTPGLVVALVGALPLAIFTRYFLERWRTVGADALVFLRLGNRSRLKQHLLFQGERLQEEIQALVNEFKPKVEPPRPSVP